MITVPKIVCAILLALFVSSCSTTNKEYLYDSTPNHDGEHYGGFQ